MSSVVGQIFLRTPVWPTLAFSKNLASRCIGRAQILSSTHLNRVPKASVSADFHTYGAAVGPGTTVFYFGRNEVWRSATPPEHRPGRMVLVDFSLGGGCSTTRTPNPCYLDGLYPRLLAARRGQVSSWRVTEC